MAVIHSFLRTHWRRITGAALGAAAGYAYYYFVGCSSGACPISSNPWISTAYGALVGTLVAPSRKSNDSPSPVSADTEQHRQS